MLSVSYAAFLSIVIPAFGGRCCPCCYHSVIGQLFAAIESFRCKKLCCWCISASSGIVNAQRCYWQPLTSTSALLCYARGSQTLCVRAQASGNVAGLCSWAQAMVTYHKVATEVEPKIQTLRQAEAELYVATKEKDAAESELSVVQAKLDDMQVHPRSIGAPCLASSASYAHSGSASQQCSPPSINGCVSVCARRLCITGVYLPAKSMCQKLI